MDIEYIIGMFSISKIKVISSSIIWLYIYLIWGYSALTEAFFILLILDFILWFLKAWNKWEVKYKKLQLWLQKIFIYCLLLIAFNQANIVVWWVNIMWIWIKQFWVSYIALMELISILKHCLWLWVPIPKTLLNKLCDLKYKMDNKN